MRTKNLLFILMSSGFMASGNLAAQVYANKDNVDINGYDVVAYHNANQALRGSLNHSVTHNGTSYYFSSADNLTAFQESPNKYLPEYGGHCAFAMAMKGAQAPEDPETFILRDGKLYLFFNDYFEGNPFNTIVPWNSNEVEMIENANSNFAKL